MLRAFIFDCDGVIADTEPHHFSAFRQVLAQEKIRLTSEQYYRDYLALDDRGCFSKVFRNHGINLSPEKLNELIERKAEVIDVILRTNLIVFPGVVEFVQKASNRYPLAVASGALRHEVVAIVKHAGISDCFRALVCAEDVTEGKPSPEPFFRASSLLTSSGGVIAPAECVVIEDSIHGIHAAHSAGMKCIAVTNTYPREKLEEADLVVDSLSGLEFKTIEDLF
jgi:HAD superfamily hydrolase (TIGR01509 family)